VRVNELAKQGRVRGIICESQKADLGAAQIRGGAIDAPAANKTLLRVTLRTEPGYFPLSVDPIETIVPAFEALDVTIFLAGINGDDLPIVLRDSVGSEIYFCLCHPTTMPASPPKSSKKQET
jgi:hypothetical protein